MTWVEQLLPEQRPSFEFVISRDGALLISDVSAGKTFISLAAIEHLSPSLTLVVAPLTALDITWARRIVDGYVAIDPNTEQELPRIHTLSNNYTLCRSWKEFKQTRPYLQRGVILLIHFQLFAKLAKKLEAVPWDLVIIDECFPAGTKIITAEGCCPIESIKAGDWVESSTGFSKVKRLIKRQTSVLLTITFADGRVVKTTPNHPFFTTNGWVCAGNLGGEYALTDREVRMVRQGLHQQMASERTQILQSILRS